MTISPLTLADRARVMEQYAEIMRDKSYEELPMGQEVAAYLRIKAKRLSENSRLAYESTLDKFARQFGYLELRDFEPPLGTERLEEWLGQMWGKKQPATYNRHLSVLKDFFKHQIIRGKMHADPTMAIEPAKKRQMYRTVFSPDQARAIIASQEELRDRIALRLLLHYGLRRGSLLAIQFKHLDFNRRRLTIFAKGGKVRELPIPQPAFWHDLERHILETQAEPHHYLMQARWANRRSQISKPDRPMSAHAAHKWWYRCLAQAGIVAEGVTSGERMHKARHSAGQRILDKTGNLKATQEFLGHASIQTTGDVYSGWADERLARSIEEALEDED